MKRLTFRTENQWRCLCDGGSVEIVQLAFVCDAFHVGASLTVAGFGFGLVYWRILPVFPQWEPIETNGWAGEPQGREHGA